MTEWGRKLTALFRRDEIDAELREEMQTHLEMKASETCDSQAARREFGNVTRLVEDSRAAWGWPQIEAWLRDGRYALRVVARKPGFAATVVLTLALGIGASSTIYSLIDAVLLRPLPYPNSARLVAIHEANPADQRGRTGVSPGRLEDWQRLNSAFDALAGSQSDTLIDMTGAEPERLSAAFVSPGFFEVLGTAPALGSGLPPGAERFGGPRAIVISDGFWRRRFGSSTGVLGQRLVLAGESYVIAGVMPGSFQYPSPATEIWVPQQAQRPTC